MINILIGKQKSLSVDWDNMPDEAKAHIIRYGLQQKLNDAGAAITKDEEPDEAQRLEKKVAVAETVLEALMAGKVSVRTAKGILSLEDKIFNKVLTEYLKKHFGKDFEDKTLKDLAKKVNRTPDEIEAVINKVVEQRLPFVKAQLEAASKSKTIIEEI